jgi:hypothetical protein
MQAQWVARAIAAAAVIAAASLVLLTRAPTDEPRIALSDPSPPPTQTEALSPPASAEPPPPAPADTRAADKTRELEAMSETFRNTTFLIAIRDSGFVCNELLRVYGGIDASAKWMATCSEMHAYTVSVASTGTLQVAPMLQYFDGLAPQIIRQDLEPSSVPEPRLDQQRLPPQPQR